MQDEKPEQSALLWKKSSGISGKCSAAVCARILYFKACAGRSAGIILRRPRGKMTPEERAWAEEKLGLKDPISVQYIRWAGNALHGDFGISYKYKMDVTRVIEGRIGNTLALGGIGFLLISPSRCFLEFSVHGRKIHGWTASSVRWEPSRDAFRNSGCRCF